MNMVTKLLVLDVIVLDDLVFQQLGKTLINKLCDAKVVIRQAVLKACGLIIKNHDNDFSELALTFCKHSNWHVREGMLYIIANCLINQSQRS